MSTAMSLRVLQSIRFKYRIQDVFDISQFGFGFHCAMRKSLQNMWTTHKLANSIGQFFRGNRFYSSYFHKVTWKRAKSEYILKSIAILSQKATITIWQSKPKKYCPSSRIVTIDIDDSLLDLQILTTVPQRNNHQ